MKHSLELVPVVELPTIKDESSESVPNGTWMTNQDEWNVYYQNELKKNYNGTYEPVSPGVFQYKLDDLSKEDLLTFIRLHISDVDIKESCSFFGGYVLVMDGEKVLYPQCCGLLEEINDWNKILETNFEPFYLMEGHPAPRFVKEGDLIIIECKDDETGPFSPATKEKIVVSHNELKAAIISLNDSLKVLAEKIDECSEDFDCTRISDILIWGSETTN